MIVHEAAIEAATEALKEKLDIEAGFALTVMFRALAETALEAAMPHLRKQVADELRVGAGRYLAAAPLVEKGEHQDVPNKPCGM